MKPGRLLLGVMAAGAIAGFSSSMRAIDALTFPQGPGSDVSGFENGGFGWSFVPTTNIVVTSVGYLDLEESGGNPNVVVTIWIGTNTVLASYTGITNPGAQPDSIISTSIAPLTLIRGQLYTITAYTAPLSSSVTEFAVHDNSIDGESPFVVAPQLSQYEGLQLNQNGTFVPLSADPTENQELLYLGPTFTCDIFIPQAVLQIASAGPGSVELSWPTNAVGFSLQRSLVVTGPYTAVTNVPSVVGTNYTTTLPSAAATGFFRLAKPD
jgi:hypothetical protein